MTLTRRDFSRSLLGAGLGAMAVPGRAQTAPVEGVHYVRLAEPAPAGPAGKIEVIEFFWYECPHCHTFEPALEAWAKRQPDDVFFRRVPVWFREEPFSSQQRLFYALEALELLPALHRKVFFAIHGDRTRLRSPEDLTAFALKNGVDPLKFVAAYNSFTVQSKSIQARQTASAYKIDAVPAMGVHGRYYTNGTLANAGVGAGGGSNARMLAVVDALVAKVRQGQRG
ncbi:MAG: thiol:disulfide interchange protein DsbA/DsbL [Caldimonas sp.]